MKKCPHCGAELAGEEKTCPGCGIDLESPKKPAEGLPKFLHPFAMMAYLSVLSALIITLQLVLTPRQAPFPFSSESGGTQAKEQKKTEKNVSDKVPEPSSFQDRQYVTILVFEQKAGPLLNKLTELDTELSKPESQISVSRVQEFARLLNNLSREADNLFAPPGLGPCKPALKRSLEQLKNALDSYLKYRKNPTPELKKEFDQSLLQFRNQRNYCTNLIEMTKKKLEPELTLTPEELKRAAKEFKEPQPPSPTPPPSPPQESLPPLPPGASEPVAPQVHHPSLGAQPKSTEEQTEEEEYDSEDEEIEEDEEEEEEDEEEELEYEEEEEEEVEEER